MPPTPEEVRTHQLDSAANLIQQALEGVMDLVTEAVGHEVAHEALRRVLIEAEVLDDDEPMTEDQVEMIALIMDEG